MPKRLSGARAIDRAIKKALKPKKVKEPKQPKPKTPKPKKTRTKKERTKQNKLNTKSPDRSICREILYFRFTITLPKHRLSRYVNGFI